MNAYNNNWTRNNQQPQRRKKKKVKRHLRHWTFTEVKELVEKLGDKSANRLVFFCYLLAPVVICLLGCMFTALNKAGFWHHFWVFFLWVTAVIACIVLVLAFLPAIMSFFAHIYHALVVEEEIPSEEEWKEKSRKPHRTHYFSEDGAEVRNESSMDEDW